jgi:hypothetical protein
MSTDPILNQAAQAIKAGDKATARTLIQSYLKNNPQSAPGWYLAANVLEAKDKQIEALQRALAIEPNYEPANTMLANLRSTNDSEVPLASSVPATPKQPRSVLPLIAALVVVLVLIVVGGIFLVERQGQHNTDASATELIAAQNATAMAKQQTLVAALSATFTPSNTPTDTSTNTPTTTPTSTPTPSNTPSATIACPATWSYTFNVASSPAPFQIVPKSDAILGGDYGGNYVPGVGFTNAFNGSANEVVIDVTPDFALTQITSVSMVYTSTGPNVIGIFRKSSGGIWFWQVGFIPATISSTPVTFTDNTPFSTTTVGIILGAIGNNKASMVISQVSLSGMAPNPFCK